MPPMGRGREGIVEMSKNVEVETETPEEQMTTHR
jgi:hypothetical protein